jgi:outer membrane protein OmpA-like peptidoglycan-associated protein
MGDLDLYRAEIDPETNNFTRPVNLGYPINSVENDIFFVLNGDESQAYYSSVKSTSKGDQDIYRVDMTKWQAINLDSLLRIEKVVIARKVPEPETVVPPVTPEIAKSPEPFVADIGLELTVLDARTLDTLEAEVVLINLVDQKVTSGEKIGPKYGLSFSNDRFAQYRIKINKGGYLPYESMIHVLGAEKRKHQLKETIALNPVENTYTGIMNVFFGHDSATPNGYEDLQYLEYLMKDNPGIKVEINGYTDNTGDPAYNKSLSQRRADAVKDYLIEHGIDGFRVETMGYGIENPIGDNETRIGRRLNRRTEFKITL